MGHVVVARRILDQAGALAAEGVRQGSKLAERGPLPGHEVERRRCGQAVLERVDQTDDPIYDIVDVGEVESVAPSADPHRSPFRRSARERRHDPVGMVLDPPVDVREPDDRSPQAAAGRLSDEPLVAALERP